MIDVTKLFGFRVFAEPKYTLEDTRMDYSEWNQEQQPEQPQQAPVRPSSPFANSPYESAFDRETPHYVAPAAPIAKRTSGKIKLWPVILVCLAATVLSAAVTAFFVNNQWKEKNRVFEQVVDNKLAVLQEKVDSMSSNANEGTIAPSVDGAMTPGQVYDQNVKAVVAISNEALSTNFFGEVSRTASSGSGFVISENGYVVTNYHVVSGATTLKVITYDSQEHSATLVGYDSANDLAVLKIEATDLACVELGSSDALVVGDQVAAIGNPLGELTSTLTVGYVSAKDRTVLSGGGYVNMLQTDAAINSGNSGGPLFNMLGEVIGITTAKYSGTSGSGATIEGIGFAIPIDDVRGMIDDLVEKGYISSAYLGVMVQDVDATAAQKYGFPMGVYVESVSDGFCAQKAGIQAKDIIVNLAGHDVKTLAELTRVLRELEPGLTTTVTVYRGGTEVHLEITLDEKPETLQTETPQAEQMPEQGQSNGWSEDEWGSDDWSSLFPFFGFGG